MTTSPQIIYKTVAKDFEKTKQWEFAAVHYELALRVCEIPKERRLLTRKINQCRRNMELERG